MRKILAIAALLSVSACVAEPYGYEEPYAGGYSYGYDSYPGDVWGYNYYDTGWSHGHHANYSYRYNDWHSPGHGAYHYSGGHDGGHSGGEGDHHH